MDLRLVPLNQPIITLDLLLNPIDGQLDESESLQTSVLVQLCSDALAAPEDVLPYPNSNDRKGWWGDTHSDTIWNWPAPIGSKLWLLKRAAITDSGAAAGSTIGRVEAYITAALQPYIDKKICSSVSVNAYRPLNTNDRIYARVKMFRGPIALLNLEFQVLWNELGFN